MTIKEIKDKLTAIIKSIGNFDKAISEDKNFFSEKVFDSMEAIDYMIRIEEVFGIEMNMEILEMHKLGKISSMAEFILKNNK
jgi:acyl carrier protein